MSDYSTIKEAILRVAARGKKFQADDVRAELPNLPTNRNLIGLAFKNLSQTKAIRPIGNSVSAASERAGGSQRVWFAGQAQGVQPLGAWQ